MVLSFALWGLVFALPFLEVGTTTKWVLGLAIYVLSYLFFFVAIALLGRERYQAIKTRVRRFFQRRHEG